jgi:hypothetical protein
MTAISNMRITSKPNSARRSQRAVPSVRLGSGIIGMLMILINWVRPSLGTTQSDR